ncbi:sushi, von Willebrand factor type A, EGF and pentraxin domain-containing protein 1 [Eurytemora carolleeae]|uniref:sushi, von Willebrand factor type A, EGF and pentraxin domain-containing protein 1 n=1 Tax=Eurytemora carolleeae TaxID=1294199 RepID=UPI000C78ED49|nr:sushi, von Willebrand factor type A, EGF and pentraxin domain-containing protein 1 [Eurytemora carolleeae]|eukprot:XP_023343359.1 sushi, von Willebrand factor type A, EGF and pentraxin domain-containing protein 1-like [Eurytemora affinis]
MISILTYLFLVLEVWGSEPELFTTQTPEERAAPPCTHPGNIENGLTDWNGTGKVARFACYQGYYLVGPPELKCRYGVWYADAPIDRPTCKPVICSHPNIPHGSLSSGVTVKYKTNENAVVICDDGFKLKHKSNNKIVCREDGSWSSLLGSEFPTCEERGCFYSEASNPEIGDIEINGIKLAFGSSSYHIDEDESEFGLYRPGSVMKHTCQNGWVVVPVGAVTRACRRGRWDGQQGKCIKTVPRMKPQGSCSSPPFINNGYFLSERYSGEKPYVLPVSGNYQHTYEVGAVARYHCNQGYRLHMLFGQDIYRCTASGTWSPKQPPVCTSRTNNIEPLSGMMCAVPEDVAYASYRAVEGVVTPNGALHGSILEYNCNIGYRDTILPCLPSRRTCHAGEWIGSLPSCAPFEFCPSVPRIQNGYLATPREDLYRLHSIIKYGCDRGFWMAGVDTMQCQATGCWEPNALPKCIDENLLSTWSEVKGWVRTFFLHGVRDGETRGGDRPPPPPPVDRVALIAFADQDPVVLPSYEEALREGVGNTRSGRERGPGTSTGYRNHPQYRRSRHHHEHIPVQVNAAYNGTSRHRRRHEPDSVSHHSLGWPVRQASSTTTSQSTSLRSGSVQSVETVGNSEGTATTETSQTPSCRALAGSLASFDATVLNTEGIPLLEENEFESGSNSVSEHADTVSAYSDSSSKSNHSR